MDQNKTKNFDQVFYQILEEGYSSDSPYDHVVLFSGGKDSTYIAHKMRQAKGGRVCLFTVDNGFEGNSYMDNLKKVASSLEMDLFIYVPPADNLIKFYKFLITEDLLKDFDSNPLCFFCARYFMALGLEFADRLHIPFVSYGATPTQLTGNKLARNLQDIELFEPAARMMRERIHRKISGLDIYQSDSVLKNTIDKIFYVPKRAKLMYPFQYIEYNIQTMINTLESEYGWEPPSKELTKEEYLTSGCELLDLVYTISNKRGFKMHEPEQIEDDYEHGLMEEKAYKFNKKLFGGMLDKSPSEQVTKNAKILGVDHLIDS